MLCIFQVAVAVFEEKALAVKSYPGHSITNNLKVAAYLHFRSCTQNRGHHFQNTVEPRFNKVPRDWGSLFVISRVRYNENLGITNLWKNNQNVRYNEV